MIDIVQYQYMTDAEKSALNRKAIRNIGVFIALKLGINLMIYYSARRLVK